MEKLCTWKLLRTTRRIRIRGPFVRHRPLTYRTRNFPPPAPLPENTKHREYFPGCFPPFTSITYYRVRAHRTPRIALLYVVILCLLCIHYFFPLFSPVDYETDADATEYDYVTDDTSSFLAELPGKPPLWSSRYHPFYTLMLALDFATVIVCSYSDA